VRREQAALDFSVTKSINTHGLMSVHRGQCPICSPRFSLADSNGSMPSRLDAKRYGRLTPMGSNSGQLNTMSDYL
jgi:hypothetical protein